MECTLLRAAVLISSLAGVLYSGPVIYNFSGNPAVSNPGVTEIFQYTASDFITDGSPGVTMVGGVPVLELFAAQLDSCTNCYTGSPVGPAVIFYPDSQEVQFNASNNIGSTFTFPSGSFGAAGVYDAISIDGTESATLTVTTTVVPEPSTSGLLTAGILLALSRWRGKVKAV